MLSVDIEKIIPVTEARDMFNKIVDEVEGSDNLYVLTKNGKPAAVVVGVNHLEKLTGETSGEIQAKVEKASEEPADEEEPIKPFDTTPAEPAPSAPSVPPADEPAIPEPTTPANDPFSATPTDSFSTAPTNPAPTTPAGEFNAAPAMPDATPSAPSTPDPMAPVTDGDAKPFEPTPAPNTPTTDPMSASKTPNSNDLNNQPPATPPASNLG